MTTVDRVQAILLDHPGADHGQLLTPATRFAEDLGCDSLDMTEILLRVEEAYHLEIPDTDAGPLTTVGALVAYLDRRQRQAATGDGHA